MSRLRQDDNIGIRLRKYKDPYSEHRDAQYGMCNKHIDMATNNEASITDGEPWPRIIATSRSFRALD